MNKRSGLRSQNSVLRCGHYLRHMLPIGRPPSPSVFQSHSLCNGRSAMLSRGLVLSRRSWTFHVNNNNNNKTPPLDCPLELFSRGLSSLFPLSCEKPVELMHDLGKSLFKAISCVIPRSSLGIILMLMIITSGRGHEVVLCYARRADKVYSDLSRS